LRELTWMAAGAWSGVAMICSTLVNANPFRDRGHAAEPRHFDPYQLLADRRKVEPKMRVRVSVLKDVFIDQQQRG
jgi:hypothetical protein